MKYYEHVQIALEDLILFESSFWHKIPSTELLNSAINL